MALVHVVLVLVGAALSRDGVVGSNAAVDGGQRSAIDQFDDGRYINRLAFGGQLELGGGWQLDPGYVGADEPAVMLRPAGAGAFWWQTRDLDFGLVAALQSRWYLGDVAEILQHRPDLLVELDLDARGGERIGVDMRGRVNADSGQRFPTARPEPWQPWSVPLWGADYGDGLAPVTADLQPVVSFYPELSTAIELGANLELDQHRWLEPQRVLFGREPELRLGAGPILGARFDLTPDLSLLVRGQGGWHAWSHADGTTTGWDVQTWGGLDGRVASFLWLRVLAGWGGGSLATADLDSTLGPGLLASGELELGREGLRSFASGYRRGPLDLHIRYGLEGPYHYGWLRYSERGLRGLEIDIEAGYRHEVPTHNELPAAAALARGELTWWLLDWLGLGAAGFFEQSLTVEDGWPWPDLQFYGGYGALKIGKVQAPSWRRPG